MNSIPRITDPTWIFTVVLTLILSVPLVFRWLRIPPIIGLIVAGVLVGPHAFNVLAYDSSFELFGQVGIYYIMFLAGLELEMGSVEKYGRDGFRFGFLTFSIPFVLGLAASVWVLHYSLATSLLMACIFASHTLVTYPTVGRYGLGRHRVVVVSVVATAFALFAALLVLAVVVGGRTPGMTWLSWVFFALRCGLYVGFVVFFFPRLCRWFFRLFQDGVLQFLFVLGLVFLSASMAKLVGLEGLLGAFLGGLTVNRLIPKTSPLMSRIEFVGNALFIPYFLLGVGMIIDVGILARHPETIWLVLLMVVVGTLTKFLASAMMAWTMGEEKSSMWLMFGLTNAHAAGALAIVTIGTAPDVMLMNDQVLGGTVMLILFSCIISGFATSRGAKQLALSDTTLEDNRGSYHGRCLITYSQEDNVDVMTQLAILIRNPFIPDGLMGLCISLDNGQEMKVNSHPMGRRLLEKAELIAASADVPMLTLNRVSTNIAGGILQTMTEYECGEVIVCLNDRVTGEAKSSLGPIIDDVVSGSHREVMAVRCIVPPGTIRRVIVAVPEKAQFEVGFYKWLEHICRIGEELDCHLEYFAHAETLPFIKGYMEQKHSHVRTEFTEMNQWMSFVDIASDLNKGCMFVAVTARPGFISYRNEFDELPLLLHDYFNEVSVMLLYPDQRGEPQENLSVFTPNGTAVQRQPRSLGGLIRRWFLTFRRSSAAVLLLIPALLFASGQGATAQAQRPRYDKMSPMVRQAVIKETAERLKDKGDGLIVGDGASKAQAHAPAQSSPRMLVLVQSDSEDVLRQHGCRTYSHWGNIYAAAVPKAELGTLSLRPEVSRIEGGRPCEALTDTSAIITRSDVLRIPTHSRPSYTGRGVVVGVMDIGFDLTNPTFYSRDLGTYRIRSFWDMLDFGGQETEDEGQGTRDGGQETVVNGQELPVGTAYTSSMEVLRKACSSDSRLQYHGSHTASTAAGSGYDSPYIGMAPDADICLVSNAVSDDKPLIPDSLWDFYGPALDLLGFEYIFRYADEVGKPCVISFSEGSHEDLWGEAQLYSTVLDSLVRPGRLICAAAGNQSLFPTYMHKPVGKARVASILGPTGNTSYYMLRSRGNFSITFDVMESPTQTLLNYEKPIADVLATEDSLVVDTVQAGNFTFQITIGCYPCCYDRSQLVTDFVITKIGKGNLLAIKMGLGVNGEDAEVEAYQEIGWFVDNDDYPDYQDAEPTHNIHYPGSDPNVICVGATSYKTGFVNCDGKWMDYDRGRGGEVANYSSRGPTLSGIIKPDVLAPGTNVVAGFNSYYTEMNPDDYMLDYDVARSTFKGRTYAWSSQRGTSMACPIVAGIIAQWMEALPTLTRAQVIEAFAASCRRHDPLLTYPNNDYGYGEIDAEAGLNYLMETYDGIQEIQDSRFQNPDASPAIYDLQGRKVNSPSHGIYIIVDKEGTRRKIHHSI